ncbi:MAG: hypothetical protein RMJ35_14160, partial [Phycisphaerales bacterium]|nr:hypothetical protein [Phycisphaerales bacterium]
MDRIELFAGQIDEILRRRIRGLRQRLAAEGLLDEGRRAGEVAILHEDAEKAHVSVRARSNLERIRGQFAGVAFMRHDVFAALAAVWTDRAEIYDVPEESILNGAEHARWNFQDEGLILHVELQHPVNGRRIRG